MAETRSTILEIHNQLGSDPDSGVTVIAMEELKGKVAVVTGASEGIGAAIAKELVRAGLIVVGLAKRKDKIEALRASLFGAPGQLFAFECDVTSEQSVHGAFEWIEKTQGGVTFLINNAGIITKHLFTDENNMKDFRLLLDSTFIAMTICVKEAVKSMKFHEVDGQIVNINSIFGHKTNTCVPGTRPINGLYPMVKHGITAMTECLRQEMMYLESSIKVSVRSG